MTGCKDSGAQDKKATQAPPAKAAPPAKEDTSGKAKEVAAGKEDPTRTAGHEPGDGHEKHGEKMGDMHEHAKGAVGHMQHMRDVKAWLKEELKDNYDKAVGPVSKKQLASGKAIYTKTCVACHGTGGKGDGPAAAALPQKPADFTNAPHSKFYSDQGRIHIIKKGVKDSPMVGWESTLKEKEILAVHGYIRSLRNTGDKKSDSHDGHDHKH